MRKDYTGCVFGMLTVIGDGEDYVSPSGHIKRRLIVQCSCGSEPKTVGLRALNSGDTISCGCYIKQKFKEYREFMNGRQSIKHGETCNGEVSKEYLTYHNMKLRCKNKSNKDYHRKGIEVCERWLESFENFLEDMGRCPEGMSIDRIDPYGNYEPDNCRWADNITQARNKTKYRRNTSGRTGVFLDKKSGKWHVRIKQDGVLRNLGAFLTFEEAVAVREKAELGIYGFIKK